MTTSSIRKHAGPGPTSDQPPVPEPTFAERARTLVYLGRIGSLSTLSRRQPGFWFGSVMPYGLDDPGRPIFLISTTAMHTQNLQADSRASLLVTQEDAGGDPLGASRVTLIGNVLPVPDAEVADARREAFGVMLNLLQPERSLTLLAAGTGLRISECLGLRRQDVSFAEAATYVRGRGPVAQWVCRKAKRRRPQSHYIPYWMTLCSAGNVGRHMLSRATGCSPHSG